jgi:hypothetical protein
MGRRIGGSALLVLGLGLGLGALGAAWFCSSALRAWTIDVARSADVSPDSKERALSEAALANSAVVAREPGGTLGRQTAVHVAAAVPEATPPTAAAEEPAAAAKPAPSEAPADSQAAPASDTDHFFGLPDAPIRAALGSKGIVSVEKGRGGRSLGFKITLEGGQKGYFKGEQVFSAANWFGEIAAYHLDRMLGLHRVPAMISRQFAWSQLEPAAGADWRKPEMIIRGGQVRGAFVAWISGGVRPLVQQEGWERWMRVKHWPTSAVSPYQRPAVWASEILQAKRAGDEWRSKEERARIRNLKPEPDRDDRPSELSDLIVFDYLIRNLDRWGGGNANVLIHGEHGPLVFLDNAAGFEPGEPRPSLMEARLRALQRFRRSTIAAIKAFDRRKYEARLASEPVQPILGTSQLDALELRRNALLAWVSELERTYGEAIWAWE